MAHDLFAPTLDAGVRWSVLATPLHSADELVALEPDLSLPSASAAKLLVLLTVARGIHHGVLDAQEPLDRRAVAPVHDSGLWQHLSVDHLSVDDAARLVGMVSDNLATNVLIDRLGGVDRIARVDGVALHDIVRDERGPQHPPTLSSGSARGYVDLLRLLWHDDGEDRDASARVRGWLRDSVDLSMVGSAFGLDPLAHPSPDRGLTLANKTGTDTGTRVDVGVVTGPAGRMVYACLARWEPGDDDPLRDDVLGAMRGLGMLLRDAVA